MLILRLLVYTIIIQTARFLRITKRLLKNFWKKNIYVDTRK